MHRFEWPGDDEPVEFNLPHGRVDPALPRATASWSRTWSRCGRPTGATSTYRTREETEWARRWPMEQIWKAAQGVSLSDTSSGTAPSLDDVGGGVREPARERNWATNEITWGIWDVPRVRAATRSRTSTGKDVVELGCGTAYVSRLARAARRARRSAST